MNIKRGLFRLWIVISCVWIAGVALLFWDQVASPYIPLKNYLYVDKAGEAVLIPDTTSAYELEQNHTIVEFDNHNVRLFVESSLPVDTFKPYVSEFRAKFVTPRDAELSAARRSSLWSLIGATLIPCAVVFVFGAALVWAISGFSASKRSPV